jgi:hypothetical protein
MKEMKVAPRACDPASPRVAKMPPPTMPPMPIEKAPATPRSRCVWPVPAQGCESFMLVPLFNLTEDLQVEVIGRRGGPQSERIDGRAAVAHQMLGSSPVMMTPS